MNSDKSPCSPCVLEAQWIERPPGIRAVMDSIPVGDSNDFFVPFSCHVDQFTFHTSDLWLELQFSSLSNERNLLPPSILRLSRIPRVKIRKSCPFQKIIFLGTHPAINITLIPLPASIYFYSHPTSRQNCFAP